MASSNSTSGSSVTHSNLDWALAYQRTGLVLLPLWPGMKAPHASKRSPERAVLGEGFRLKEVGECSEEWVRRCWEFGQVGGDPTNGIGVVCGSRSRLLLIDIDVKNSGEFAWEAWRVDQEIKGNVLPETPLVRTPSGGFHLWFRLPEGEELRSWDGWLPGVDVLADGHWAAVPPTFTRESGKTYEFLRSGATPEVPEWFLKQIAVRGRGGMHRPAWASGGGVGEGGRFDWVKALSESIQPGEQQNTLFRAAASARARGWDDEKALGKLRAVMANFIEDSSRDPWTDEHVVEAWERVKREYEDGDGVEGGELEEVEIPEYTPWFGSNVEEVVDVTNSNGRPQLRIIQGEGGGAEEEVSEPEAPSGGDEGIGGAGLGGLGLPPGGGWEIPPTTGNTDEEHAREFHRLYGEQVLWVPGLEWHSWTGTHWKPDDAHDVNNLLTHLGYRIEAYRDSLRALGEGDFTDQLNALGRRVDKLWNARSVGGVKSKAEPYAQIWNGEAQSAERLDTRPTLVNTTGETLEFVKATGEVRVRSHDPANLITRCLTVGYDPDARSELLDRYRQTFMPEDDHWEALWRLVGSCLLGGNDQRQLIFFVGESTTGKSLLMQLLMEVLGNYASLGYASLFRGNLDERPRADLIGVMTSRIVFIEELGHGWEMHADRVKDITGGGKITARKLHSNHYVTRNIDFTVVAVTNELPKIKNPDSALLRRVKVVPFDRSLLGAEDITVRDTMLQDRKLHEAVLVELVEGARRAIQRGVEAMPARFLEARAAAYGALTGGDDLAEFIDELRHRGLLVHEATQSKCVFTRELFELYAGSPGRSRDREIQGMSPKQFAKLLRMLGFETKNVNGGTRALGWGLSGGFVVAKGMLGA